MPKQSKEPLYRIEEMGTSGWSLAEDIAQRLTKEQCKKMYDQIMFRLSLIHISEPTRPY